LSSLGIELLYTESSIAGRLTIGRNGESMRLHPKILKKNGRSEFVILPYEEFLAVQERLEDIEDLLDLREAMKQDHPLIPGMTLEEVRAELGLTPTRPRRRRSAAAKRRKNVARR
jgi:hypothetical protein